MSNDVGKNKTGARFLPDSDMYRKSDNSIKPKAFTKNPNDGTTSCFDVTELDIKDIWIYASPLEQKIGKLVHGFAKFNTTSVYEYNLKAKYTPPQKHFEIYDWSTNQATELNQRQNLARKSTFIRNPKK